MAADDRRVYDAAADGFGEALPDVFATPQWLAASRAYVEGLRRAARENRLLPEAYLAPAATLVGLVAGERGAVSVLDLGGGIGPCVDPLVLGLLPGTRLTYLVVDNAANAALGRELFADTPGVMFATSIPEGFSPDVALASSALQYIPDWRAALAAMVQARPRFLALPRTPRAAGPTLAVRQCLRFGDPVELVGKAWHWIFGPELDREIASLGYRPIHDHFIRDLTAEMADATDSIGRCDLRTLGFVRDGGMS